uniref:Uncharacterized protein n=1 Tax=Leptocylindrus danicus TaxID=163516 RepID=A0A7S2JUP9_9STRA|mmetsp:Transcript_11977/g.18075  ORF Transcript_11977/g.18075 Transcript_11977/m.18075 type:complete len:423 (+) Transcript_11977:73-1341(+)
MIPSNIISLLVKNDFIGSKDLGVLACANSALRQFVCSDDSDDDIWLHLLRKTWPSTRMIDGCILIKNGNGSDSDSGLRYREWLERLTTADVPGNSKLQLCDGKEIARMRKEFRSQLRLSSMGEHQNNVDNDGEFSPLSEPIIASSDLLILVDASFRGNVFASMAIRGDEDNSALFRDFKVNIPRNQFLSLSSHFPIEMTLGRHGDFTVDEDLFSHTVHMVRLTDFKIIRVSCETRTYFHSQYDFLYSEDRMRLDTETVDCDFSLEAKVNLFGSGVGTFPTLLNSRLGDYNLKQPRGLSFKLCSLLMTIPRSPYHFGYDHTVSKYREHARLYAHQPATAGIALDFQYFKGDMWFNASSNKELLKFYNQCSDSEPNKNGKFFATVRASQPELALQVSCCNRFRNEKYMAGATLLHLVEDLFECG